MAGTGGAAAALIATLAFLLTARQRRAARAGQAKLLRYVGSDKVVELPSLPEEHFHLFLSHGDAPSASGPLAIEVTAAPCEDGCTDWSLMAGTGAVPPMSPPVCEPSRE